MRWGAGGPLSRVDGMAHTGGVVRKGWLVSAVLVAVVFGALLAARPARPASGGTSVYTYTGRVDSVCGHPRGAVPPCFAVAPDAGTAREDGYYGGQGDVSFGPPPSDGLVPHLGQHVTVTVATVIDRGAAVVDVS